MELNRARKPALKAVLQGDAAACRPLILCVSRVYSPEDLGARRGTAAAVIEVCMEGCFLLSLVGDFWLLCPVSVGGVIGTAARAPHVQGFTVCMLQ